MNKSQLEAVEYADGALELLAGPGSGKTFVITHRIKYLIYNLGVPPEQILVITFTKASALEMQKRYNSMQFDGMSGPTFGTFHAVFYQILRSNPSYKGISLITEHEKLNIIEELLQQLYCEEYVNDCSFAGIQKQISKFKNDTEAVADPFNDVMGDEAFQNFYEQYNQMLRNLGKLDFDDMVGLCDKMLSENKNYLVAWQKRFSHILIDEFQDINLLQYGVIKKLFPSGKVFVVGDICT